ncbi:hypothetical protein QN277_013029 [Acacia crassicarpa]|uniref:Reverse transcriptase domain-containing protein n=1 Tax=Acacia crassicarpa TaxID=499986 RepID=A0AAE1N347_9FABA|nr:hypothetical protein QN277_013029 [Acacia crassicarpa]
MAFVPSLGRSGGMVVAWKKDSLHATVLHSDRQFIHFRIIPSRNSPLLLTAIYAIPDYSLKQTLWSELENLASSIVEPWVNIGDFNDIRVSSERFGGFACSDSRMKLFNDCLQQCRLSDLGFHGSLFTWKGPRYPGCRRLFERLDRALVNDSFLAECSNCFIQVLPRTQFSDHNPICLKSGNSSVTARPNRPFRFEAMWDSHKSFKEFPSGSWNQDSDLNLSLSNLQAHLAIWNREVFGMVEAQKHNILARLGGIQRSQAYPHSEYLCNLEYELQGKLSHLLKLEEIKWFQKSRSEWITKGDHNTRYYHLKTKMRRRRNRVVTLKDNNGVWVENEVAVKNLVIDYFKTLFCSGPTGNSELHTRANFPRIDQSRLANLGRPPSNEEIRSAMFSMGNYKAPGYDGFPPIFYKNNWNTMGPSVCNFVKEAFKGNLSLADSNRTLIALIAKKDHVEFVSNFRPISLCMVHYKCLTKLIATRLRGVMNDIISPFQSSFIKGRQIHDNIIVGQEILHTMNKTRSRKGLMAMKIDFEKAFDRINWGFLQNVLLDVGLDSNLVSLIINCVSSVSYNVL